MPDPIALCIENLEDDAEQVQFIRCVALSGGQAGLCVDARGRPLWCDSAQAAFELWVSADERLVLWRALGAPAVLVRRAHRSLDAPHEKPVIVLDQDELEIAGKRLRLHVHGPTAEVHPPTPLVPHALGAAAALATAIAMSAAAIGCSKTAPVEPTASSEAASAQATPSASVAPAAAATAAGTVPSAAPSAAASSAAPDVTATATKTPSIEVRPHPPKPVRR